MKSFVNLESATIPNVMDDIGEDCVNLESATSPEIIDDIGEDSVNLESATSPNVMDDIGEDCVNLESATSPEIMDDIGEDCIKLESAENINDISPVPNSIIPVLYYDKEERNYLRNYKPVTRRRFLEISSNSSDIYPAIEATTDFPGHNPTLLEIAKVYPKKDIIISIGDSINYTLPYQYEVILIFLFIVYKLFICYL
jgi:hypothetical protein